MILGIDTSAGQCAIALVGETVYVRAEPMQRGHAEALFPMIEAVLDDAKAEYADLERIGVCTGPGSFTGIRVGIAAARGIALGCNVEALGVSRFEALAAEHGSQTVALPGRKGEVFIQDFEHGRPLGAPRLGDGEAADMWASPEWIARLVADRPFEGLPAPLYMRGANADPPREAPPTMLD